MLTKLRIDDLEIDPEAIQLQSRGLNGERIQEYVIRMSAGDKFPPIDVFNDGGTLYLAGGFHRVKAAMFLGLEEIEANVREGTLQDAMIFAAIDNIGAGHGEPMSQAQKREAGVRLLRLTDWSQGKIARELAVTPAAVSKWAASINKLIDTSRTVTRNGTTYTMDVSNIGKSEPEPESQPEPSFDFELPPAEEDEPELELCGHCTWNNRHDSWICLKTGEIWPVDALQKPCPCDLYIPESQYVHEPEDEPELEDEEPNGMSVHFASATPEHYTPQCIINATLACLGEIDLDPCSNSLTDPVVPAKRHFTADDDGLRWQWHGRTYMNPPYGRQIDSWIAKLCEEHEAGRVTEAIALVPARTDTQWWLRLRDYPVCFIQGRLTFGGNSDPAPFPSAVFYLGEEIGNFYRAFYELGDCWRRVRL